MNQEFFDQLLKRGWVQSSELVHPIITQRGVKIGKFVPPNAVCGVGVGLYYHEKTNEFGFDFGNDFAVSITVESDESYNSAIDRLFRAIRHDCGV